MLPARYLGLAILMAEAIVMVIESIFIFPVDSSLDRRGYERSNCEVLLSPFSRTKLSLGWQRP